MKQSEMTEDVAASEARKALGFYSWDVQSNRVFGDEVVAYAFGLQAEEFTAGVPIERVLSRVEESDRETLAKVIHETILNGLPFSQTYSVAHDDGSSIRIAANGRCLRDFKDLPSIYTGTILVEPGGFNAHFASDPLVTYCRAALGIATSRHNSLAARYLSSALGALRGETA